MDPWQRGRQMMANGPGGSDAEYCIKGVGPALKLRVVVQTEDDDAGGRVVTRTVALVPVDDPQIGRPEAGDTILVQDKFWRVAQVADDHRGAWRLTLAVVK